ncbi:VOC family protein [Brevundimonas bacteroides]|uniref:VOC family protein n=1 Tax=Brevundimonas bacteroides TaxID=74311 RepID=UPI000496966A|nr:VOC family protein [Brevundimonas bacteroides]
MAIKTSGMTPLLQVYDMPEAVAFYRDVLGFDVVSASPEVDTPEGRFSHWMWLRLGSADLMLNTAYDEGQRPAERVEDQQRWHRDTCNYFGCDDVDAVYKDLSTKLPDLHPPRDAPYGMRQLSFSDPDGYGVCFQAPIG